MLRGYDWPRVICKTKMRMERDIVVNYIKHNKTLIFAAWKNGKIPMVLINDHNKGNKDTWLQQGKLGNDVKLSIMW